MPEIKEGYLRTTEILQPFSGVEFVPTHLLECAGDRGTRTHTAIEAILNGFESPFYDDDIEGYIDSFMLFWEGNRPHGLVETEVRLYDEVNRFTGQIDCIIRDGEDKYLFDWKTSARPHRAWRLQAAAYRWLASKDASENVSNVKFVRLKKDGKKPTITTWDSYEEDLKIFFKCLELHQWFDMKNSRRKHEN